VPEHPSAHFQPHAKVIDRGSTGRAPAAWVLPNWTASCEARSWVRSRWRMEDGSRAKWGIWRRFGGHRALRFAQQIDCLGDYTPGPLTCRPKASGSILWPRRRPSRRPAELESQLVEYVHSAIVGIFPDDSWELL